MLLLLIALQAAAPPVETSTQETKATLQSCETTEKGWVCHYQIPSATIVLDAPPIKIAPPAVAAIQPAPPQSTAQSPVAPAVASSTDTSAETSRQTRLIARCADAKWYSPCLPGERTEARVLRDTATNAASLRSKVTGLLSEKQCDEAIRVALEGGDLPLAREARAFCATSR